MHPEFGPKKWMKCSIQIFLGRKNEKWIEKWMDKAPHPDFRKIEFATRVFFKNLDGEMDNDKEWP